MCQLLCFCLTISLSVLALFACGESKKGDFLVEPPAASAPPEEPAEPPAQPPSYVVLSGGGVANSVNTTISLYDLSGNFLRILADYAKSASWPRGLAFFNAESFLVSVEGADRIDQVFFDGRVQLFASHSGFTGNIFELARDASGNSYVIEGNTIEKFDPNGVRIPLTGTITYIPTTVGACVLSTPHGLTFNNLGQLVVMSSTNNQILIYNVSGANPVCVSNTTYNATGIWDVVQHPNGLLYIVSQTTDAIYSADPDGNNLTLLYQYTPNTVNPGSIEVLPNGHLLVATHGTNSVDLFDTAGNLLEEGFIKNTLSVQVNSLLVISGQEEP